MSTRNEHSNVAENKVLAPEATTDISFNEVARLAALASLREAGAVLLWQGTGLRLVGQYNLSMPEAVRLVPADLMLEEVLDIPDVSQLAPDHPYANGMRFRLRALTSVPVVVDGDPVGLIFSFSSRKIGPIMPSQLERLQKVKAFAERLLTYQVQMTEAQADYESNLD